MSDNFNTNITLKTPFEIFCNDVIYSIQQQHINPTDLAMGFFSKDKWLKCKESFEVLKSYKDYIRKTGGIPSIDNIFEVFCKKAKVEVDKNINLLDMWFAIREISSQYVDYQNIFLFNKEYILTNNESYFKDINYENLKVDFDKEMEMYE